MHVAMRDGILVWLDEQRMHARELPEHSMLRCDKRAKYMMDVRGLQEMLS